MVDRSDEESMGSFSSERLELLEPAEELCVEEESEGAKSKEVKYFAS